MKKVIMIALSALLLVSLAACSTPATTSSSADANASSGASSSESAAATGQELFGKVKSLVGNDLTLDLAKTPDQGTIDSLKGGGGAAGESGITVTKSESAVADSGESGGEGDGADEGGENGGGGTVIAFEGENGEAKVITPGDADASKMELEYTGESKEFTIPTGLPITDMFGNELKASELKEGNVLMASLGEDGAIKSILVLE